MHKIIFAGTSDFGIPFLDKIRGEIELLAVITQPDRPVGRKQIITPSPIKQWATKHNIRVMQPHEINDIKSELTLMLPDLMIVAAYGQIIPLEILNIPSHGSINIHGSLLPKYRGASPIQASLLNGDDQTGVTLMKMDEKLDHGGILAKVEVPIEPSDDYASLHTKLAMAAVQLMDKVLPYIGGSLKSEEQNHVLATFTKTLDRKDARINWTDRAHNIHNMIRALNPEPGTWTRFENKNIKIIKAEMLAENKIELPGKIYWKDNQLAVKCGEGSIIILELIPEGKNSMTGTDFLNGLKHLESKLFI